MFHILCHKLEYNESLMLMVSDFVHSIHFWSILSISINFFKYKVIIKFVYFVYYRLVFYDFCELLVLVVFACLCKCVFWVCCLSMVHHAQKPFLKKCFTKLKVDLTPTLNKISSSRMIIEF